MYRIKDWYQLFENNRTRELKRMDWVPVPNRMDGSGYTALVDHPNGAAHLGAWLAILEISSRQKERGTFPQEGAGLSQVLARMSRLPAGLFDEVLPRLLQIGWIERDTEIPQEGAVPTRARFPSVPFPSIPFNSEKELKTEIAKTNDFAFQEWWKTWSEIRGTHHENEAAQAYISVAGGLEPEVLQCTQSYLASLDNPAKGFNPHNFLFEQVKSRFRARWPEHKNGSGKETFEQSIEKVLKGRHARGEKLL